MPDLICVLVNVFRVGDLYDTSTKIFQIGVTCYIRHLLSVLLYERKGTNKSPKAMSRAILNQAVNLYSDFLSLPFKLTVHVLDVNDNTPAFKEPRPYSVSTREDIDLETQLFVAHATDPDEGENSTITYGILTGNEQGEGQVNSFLLLLKNSQL